MGEAAYIFLPEAGIADLVEFDNIINQRTSHKTDFTKYPVEDGSRISDHAITQPVVVSFRAIVSNVISDGDTPKDIHDQLKAIYDARTLFDYQTGLDLIPNMVITKIDLPEEVDSAGGLTADIVLEEIIIVQTEQVRLPEANVSEKGAASQVNKGRAEPQDLDETKTAPEAEEERKGLKTRVLDSIFGAN